MSSHYMILPYLTQYRMNPDDHFGLLPDSWALKCIRKAWHGPRGMLSFQQLWSSQSRHQTQALGDIKWYKTVGLKLSIGKLIIYLNCIELCWIQGWDGVSLSQLYQLSSGSFKAAVFSIDFARLMTRLPGAVSCIQITQGHRILQESSAQFFW